MIITVSGLPGAGKTTVAKKLAKKLKYKFYSGGQSIGKLALQKNMTLLEFNKVRKKDTNIDKKIDKEEKMLVMKNKNIIVDGIIAFHLFPNSLKIFLKVKKEIAAKRIFKARRKDEPYKSVKEARKAVEKRIKYDQHFYKKIYGVNCHDTRNFDLVIDTSKSKNADHVVKIILKTITNIS